MPRYSDQYIDNLLEQGDYDALVQLQGIVMGWEGCDSKHATYGLPVQIFIFVEALTWFAQSLRSGAWTYYEVTPLERQRAARDALSSFAPADYSLQYALGMGDWKNPGVMKLLGRWLDTSEASANSWMVELLNANRNELSKAYA